jgi:hypothetical protein
VKAKQITLGERSPAFDHDVLTARRGRALIDVVGDALLRRFGTWESAATALDKAFGPEGRPVSPSVLRASFAPSGETARTYPRCEWVAMVADDEDVRAYFIAPVRTPAEELVALREHLLKDAPGSLERFERKVRR